jgi:hypothetical protein
VVTYSLVPPFRKAKYCGVPSGATVQVGCTVSKTSLLNTVLLQLLGEAFYANACFFTKDETPFDVLWTST